jgi:hypothetical protein
MNKAKLFAVLVSLFVTGPIWYYLFYKILVAVHATELMMFLFWVYVPISLIMGIIIQATNED